MNNFLNYFRERPIMVRNFAISAGVGLALLLATKRLDKKTALLTVAASGVVAYLTYKHWADRKTAGALATMQTHSEHYATQVKRAKMRVGSLG